MEKSSLIFILGGHAAWAFATRSSQGRQGTYHSISIQLSSRATGFISGLSLDDSLSVVSSWWWELTSEACPSLLIAKKMHGQSKYPLPTMQEMTLHVDITRWSIPKSDWLYSLQPKMEKLYTVSINKTGSWLCVFHYACTKVLIKVAHVRPGSSQHSKTV